jgi:hypothetical protein
MDHTVKVLDLGGTFDAPTLRSKCEALLAGGPVTRLLVDATASTECRSEAQRVQFACHMVVFFPEARVALLARREDIHRVAENIAARAGIDYHAFWREQAAREWLSSTADAASGLFAGLEESAGAALPPRE